MQPIGAQTLDASKLERARYLCEIAQFKIANGLFVAAAEALREALAIGCNCRWVAISDKVATSITEPDRFLEKLRLCGFLERAEFRLLSRLIGHERPTDIFDAERFVDAVARVIGSPARSSLGGAA